MLDAHCVKLQKGTWNGTSRGKGTCMCKGPGLQAQIRLKSPPASSSEAYCILSAAFPSKKTDRAGLPVPTASRGCCPVLAKKVPMVLLVSMVMSGGGEGISGLGHGAHFCGALAPLVMRSSSLQSLCPTARLLL